MLGLATTYMESASSTPPDMHGLTASQLSELQGAVQALDNYLLLCVHNLRNNRLVHTKHVTDCQVREHVVFYFINRSFCIYKMN